MKSWFKVAASLSHAVKAWLGAGAWWLMHDLLQENVHQHGPEQSIHNYTCTHLWLIIIQHCWCILSPECRCKRIQWGFSFPETLASWIYITVWLGPRWQLVTTLMNILTLKLALHVEAFSWNLCAMVNGASFTKWCYTVKLVFHRCDRCEPLQK